MSIITELKELSGDEMVRHSIVLSSAVCPGILTLQIFKPELLLTLPVVNAVLLAISLSLPLLILLYILVMLSDHVHSHGEPLTPTVGLAISSLLASALEYTVLVSAYLNKWSLRDYISTINSVILVGLVGLAWLAFRLGRKERKDKSANGRT